MTDKQKQQMMIRLPRKLEMKMWEGENLYFMGIQIFQYSESHLEGIR